MTLFKQYGIDLIVGLSFIVAILIGCRRSYRFSLMQFILQIISLIATYFGARFLTIKAMAFVPSEIEISLLVPDSLSFLIQPHEEVLIPLLIFLVCYVFLFVMIKGFLYSFSLNYEWERIIFPRFKLKKNADCVMSALFTMLNAYTYVIVFLIFVSFPLLGLVHPSSISGVLLTAVPFISNEVVEFYEPYQFLLTYDQEANEVFDGTTFSLEKLLELIKKNPSQKVALQEAYRELIPSIATTEKYLQEFSSYQINEEKMADYLEKIENYLDEGILTLENFNFYYEALIQNKSYDRLVEGQAIDKEALALLMKSGLLNEANQQKIKEYITLD